MTDNVLFSVEDREKGCTPLVRLHRVAPLTRPQEGWPVGHDPVRDGANPAPTDLRIHDLRHTRAALLIEAGRHMEEVKDHLGHSSMRVTSDYYGHLFPRARRAVAASLDTAYQQAALQRSADNLRTTLSVVPTGDRPPKEIPATTEVISFGAEDGIRTRDPHLGKVM